MKVIEFINNTFWFDGLMFKQRKFNTHTKGNNVLKYLKFNQKNYSFCKQYPEGTLDANVPDAANGGANANAPGTEDNEVGTHTHTLHSDII